jgi:hypothetical protein
MGWMSAVVGVVVACAAVVMAGESSSTMRYTTTTRPILANQPWNGTVYWDLSLQCEIEDIPHEARCMYVSTNKDCAAKSRIPYLQIAYCHIGNAIPLAYEPPTPLLPLTNTPNTSASLDEHPLPAQSERTSKAKRAQQNVSSAAPPPTPAERLLLAYLSEEPSRPRCPYSCTRMCCTHAHLGRCVATVHTTSMTMSCATLRG